MTAAVGRGVYAGGHRFEGAFYETRDDGLVERVGVLGERGPDPVRTLVVRPRDVEADRGPESLERLRGTMAALREMGREPVLPNPVHDRGDRDSFLHVLAMRIEDMRRLGCDAVHFTRGWESCPMCRYLRDLALTCGYSVTQEVEKGDEGRWKF